MSSQQKLVNRLRTLDPQSEEFYAAAARHFWQRVRSHRNYGRFFLLLATLSWALLFLNWDRWKLVLLALPAFLFCGFIGWLGIAGAARTARALYDADHEKEIGSRLRRLRDIALSFPGDPISSFVVEATDKSGD
jgi:hypothetical protein